MLSVAASMRPDLGQSRPWASCQNPAVERQLLAAQPQMTVNGYFRHRPGTASTNSNSSRGVASLVVCGGMDGPLFKALIESSVTLSIFTNPFIKVFDSGLCPLLHRRVFIIAE